MQHAGPFLIFCSEHDNLAPYQIICNFAQCLQDLGGDVKLVKWSGSPHLGLSWTNLYDIYKFSIIFCVPMPHTWYTKEYTPFFLGKKEFYARINDIYKK